MSSIQTNKNEPHNQSEDQLQAQLKLKAQQMIYDLAMKNTSANPTSKNKSSNSNSDVPDSQQEKKFQKAIEWPNESSLSDTDIERISKNVTKNLLSLPTFKQLKEFNLEISSLKSMIETNKNLMNEQIQKITNIHIAITGSKSMRGINQDLSRLNNAVEFIQSNLVNLDEKLVNGSSNTSPTPSRIDLIDSKIDQLTQYVIDVTSTLSKEIGQRSIINLKDESDDGNHHVILSTDHDNKTKIKKISESSSCAKSTNKSTTTSSFTTTSSHENLKMFNKSGVEAWPDENQQKPTSKPENDSFDSETVDDIDVSITTLSNDTQKLKITNKELDTDKIPSTASTVIHVDDQEKLIDLIADQEKLTGNLNIKKNANRTKFIGENSSSSSENEEEEQEKKTPTETDIIVDDEDQEQATIISNEKFETPEKNLDKKLNSAKSDTSDTPPMDQLNLLKELRRSNSYDESSTPNDGKESLNKVVKQPKKDWRDIIDEQPNNFFYYVTYQKSRIMRLFNDENISMNRNEMADRMNQQSQNRMTKTINDHSGIHVHDTNSNLANDEMILAVKISAEHSEGFVSLDFFNFKSEKYLTDKFKQKSKPKFELKHYVNCDLDQNDRTDNVNYKKYLTAESDINDFCDQFKIKMKAKYIVKDKLGRSECQELVRPVWSEFFRVCERVDEI